MESGIGKNCGIIFGCKSSQNPSVEQVSPYSTMRTFRDDIEIISADEIFKLCLQNTN